VSFEGPGTKPVEATWTLGGPALRTYRGWEAIKVLSPNVVESRKAPFELRCGDVEPESRLDLSIAGQMVKIGGKIGGSGAKSAISGSSITLTPADSFLRSGGKCAFNISYTVVSSGEVSPAGFMNRIRCDPPELKTPGDASEVVSTQSEITMPARGTKEINTQAYLRPGEHVLTLSIDDGHAVAESNESNNVVKIRVIVNCPGR
jgi:hypothetical protein